MGGAKTPTTVDGNEIINAGQALRSSSAPPVLEKKDRRGEKFRQLKKEEARKSAASTKKTVDSTPDGGNDDSGSEEEIDEIIDLSNAKDSLEEIYSRSQSGGESSSPTTKKGKRSKRKRTV